MSQTSFLSNFTRSPSFPLLPSRSRNWRSPVTSIIDKHLLIIKKTLLNFFSNHKDKDLRCSAIQCHFVRLCQNSVTVSLGDIRQGISMKISRLTSNDLGIKILSIL